MEAIIDDLASEDLKQVPVISVYEENFISVWPSLIHAIETSCLIGIDVELSGLGDRKLLNLRNIDDRYTALVSVARSRSILSLGLACFKLLENENSIAQNTAQSASTDQTHAAGDTEMVGAKKRSYLAQIYDISLLCMEDYVVEPLSLQFLVKHGFDFNKQCSSGIPYTRGNDQESDEDNKPTIRRLFSHIIQSHKKLAVHNGLVDLIFLYENLYATLPHKFNMFLADIQEMFPDGIFDTKYISEYSLQYKASYLEFVFKKLQRKNSKSQLENKPHVRIKFLYPNSGSNMVSYDDLRSFENSSVQVSGLCSNFSGHGWCNQRNCPQIHNVDLAIDQEGLKTKTALKKKRKNKKNKVYTKNDEMETDETVKEAEKKDNHENGHAKNNRGSHRAGYDAFMTAYSLLGYFADVNSPANISSTSEAVQNRINRIYLTGREQPLVIQKSNFAKTSQNHNLKKKQKIEHSS